MGSSPSKRHRDTVSKLTVAERRKKVAANLAAGWTYREIATLLEVSIATVASDYKAMLSLWKEHYTAKLDEYLYLQLRRYDLMLNAIWPDAQKGNAPLIDRALAIMDRQNALLQLKNAALPQGEPPVFQISVVPARAAPPMIADRVIEGG